MTTGFIIGDDNMNDMATFIGTFFFNSLLDTGITAQSQAGRKNPRNIPTIDPNILFLGINLTNVSSETNVSMMADISEPSNKNGRLSKKIDVNIIAMFFTMSILRFIPFTSFKSHIGMKTWTKFNFLYNIQPERVCTTKHGRRSCRLPVTHWIKPAF